MAITIGDALVKLGVDSKGLEQGFDRAEQKSKKMEDSFKRLQKVTTPLGIALTAVGVAGLKLAGDALKLNAQMAQTAITVGSTTDEMRNLVLETTNVTFGIQSVINTMEMLARAGVRGEDYLKASALAFDALGDATGYPAEEVAEMLIPAFKNLGVAIPTTAGELDMFTYLVKNTMVNLTDFAAAMDYAAVYGGDLNLTIEEMVAIMAALEDKGITGSAVTRLFRTAVSQAASGTATLTEALNLTQGEIDAFQDELKNASGITEQYAAAANKQYSVMDKLKQMWSELALRIGTFLEPMQGALIGMMALGAALVALPMIIPRVVAAIGALSVAMRSLSIAGGILGVVGTLAAIGIGLYDVIRQGRDYTESVNRWTDALAIANDSLATLEERGEGSSESADNLRTVIDKITEALERFSTVGDDNVVTTYNLIDAIEKLEGAYKDVTSVTDEQDKFVRSLADSSGFLSQITDSYIERMADLATTTIDLTAGIKKQLEAEEDLRAEYEAADEAVRVLIEDELARRKDLAATDFYAEEIKALQDYYGFQEEKEKSLLQLEQDRVSARQKSLRDELSTTRQQTNDLIREYQREHSERVSLLRSATDERVKELQSQIDALDDAESADEEARLRKAITDAWSRKGKAEAEAALDAFLLRKQRDALNQEIREVQEAARDEEAIMRDELDAKVDTENDKLRATESRITSELTLLETAVADKEALLRQEYADAKDHQQGLLDLTLDRINSEVQAQINAWNTLAGGQTAGAGLGLGLGGGLRSYDKGGPIIEDSLLVGLRSGPYAVAHKGETVSPAGGITINVNGGVYREESDRRALAKTIGQELYRQRQMTGGFGS